jgi:hypothetical protein
LSGFEADRAGGRMAVMFATILLLAYVPAFSEWIPSLFRS